MHQPKYDTKPHPTQTIRLIKTEPDRRRTPLGDIKMPEPKERRKKQLKNHVYNYYNLMLIAKKHKNTSK